MNLDLKQKTLSLKFTFGDEEIVFNQHQDIDFDHKSYHMAIATRCENLKIKLLDFVILQ